MRLALIQQETGPDREENLSRALASMRRARDSGAEMAVFAELATSRFFPQFPHDASWFGTAEPIPGRTADFRGFHEQGYYTPAESGAEVYETKVGRVGVAICYDRHYPEYMRSLGLLGAQIVAIPQAGCLGEWPEGLYEAEVRTAAFQNGYFVGLCNRVGREEGLTFAGESFVCDPEGVVLARGATLAEEIVLADLDLSACARSTARRLFWRDRRPEIDDAPPRA